MVTAQGFGCQKSGVSGQVLIVKLSTNVSPPLRFPGLERIRLQLPIAFHPTCKNGVKGHLTKNDIPVMGSIVNGSGFSMAIHICK
jgi:hypothetical protein